MKKTEATIGFIGIVLILLLGKSFLKPDIFFRLLVGAALGYTLSRAYTGFAGSVNRAYRAGSTKLMRALVYMFFITSLLTTAFLLKADPTTYGLWINPINFGLLLGGILFGFGMSCSSCCATGTMTDLVTGFSRAFVTLVFFGLGTFLGFPVQNTASWVKKSWLTSPVGAKFSGGVFFPDLFKWDGFNGYLGALVLTAILCGIVGHLANLYEKKRKLEKTYIGIPSEKVQDEVEPFDPKDYKLLSEAAYDRLFVKPWTLKQGAVVLSILFALLMGVTKAGWGASTPYGIWFGKFLMFVGVSPQSLSAFTKLPAGNFSTPFFQNPASVQDLGIIIGTAIYLLTAGQFTGTFKSGLQITAKEALLYAIGGITMGFGTRVANGCNVGALYTPIAQFSPSGWVFLAFLVCGGILGNIFVRKFQGTN